MTKQEKELGDKIIGIAAEVRKVVLLGQKKIADAAEESPFDDFTVMELTDFADLLMHGYEKQYIIDRLKIPDDTVARFDKNGLDW